MENKEIFISYRRKDRFGKQTGTMIARTILLSLEARGYKGRVFFDHDDISNEDFGEKILAEIRAAKIFVLILTENAMDDCYKVDDWVRREILEAENNGLVMICIDVNKEFDGKFPSNFPSELSIVRRINHRPIYTDANYESGMNDLVEEYIDPVLSPWKIKVSKPEPINKEMGASSLKPKKEGFFQRFVKNIGRMFEMPGDCVYNVGDYYNDGVKEGVVLSTAFNGRSGVIVSLEEVEVQWCTETEFARIEDISNNTKDGWCGDLNTLLIQEMVGWQEAYPAFAFCVNRPGDWYLPSIEELRLLSDDTVFDSINTALAYRRAETLKKHSFYWSSTEARWDRNSVHVWRFSEQYEMLHKKENALVRAFSKF